MKFFSKYKSQITENEKEYLEDLCYEDGYMWPAFQKYPGYVILCKEDDEVIAWAFIFDDLENPDKIYKTFFVYVSSDYRRMGIGSKLYQMAINKYKNLWTSKWDEKSKKFFESMGGV